MLWCNFNRKIENMLFKSQWYLNNFIELENSILTFSDQGFCGSPFAIKILSGLKTGYLFLLIYVRVKTKTFEIASFGIFYSTYIGVLRYTYTQYDWLSKEKWFYSMEWLIQKIRGTHRLDTKKSKAERFVLTLRVFTYQGLPFSTHFQS